MLRGRSHARMIRSSGTGSGWPARNRSTRSVRGRCGHLAHDATPAAVRTRRCGAMRASGVPRRSRCRRRRRTSRVGRPAMLRRAGRSPRGRSDDQVAVVVSGCVIGARAGFLRLHRLFRRRSRSGPSAGPRDRSARRCGSAVAAASRPIAPAEACGRGLAPGRSARPRACSPRPGGRRRGRPAPLRAPGPRRWPRPSPTPCSRLDSPGAAGPASPASAWASCASARDPDVSPDAAPATASSRSCSASWRRCSTCRRDAAPAGRHGHDYQRHRRPRSPTTTQMICSLDMVPNCRPPRPAPPPSPTRVWKAAGADPLVSASP